MKFKLGLPSKSDGLAIERHPFGFNYVDLHVKGSILGTMVLMPAGYLIWALFWPLKELNFSFTGGPLYFFFTLVLTLVLHELCHIIAFPGMGVGNDTYVGFDPKSVVPYVAFLGPVSRNHFLMAAMAPIILLSLTPFGMCFLFPDWVKWVSWISILNLSGAAGDILICAKILRRVPRDWHVQGDYFGPLLAERNLANGTNRKN